MKTRFVDPFTPNRPVDDPSRFFGRKDPVNELVDSLYQIENGNPKHTIITGDRGVGKSSLLTQIRLTAEGDRRLTYRLAIDDGGKPFNFFCVWHDVDSSQSVFDLAKAILSRFESALKKTLSSFSLEIDLFGLGKLSSEKANQANMAQLIDEFVVRLKKVSESAESRGKNGVLIFIDELDRIKADSMISSFFKLTTERLSREGFKKIGFISAGITGAIQKLEEEHASIFRTFRDVPLLRFDKTETREILMSGFSIAKHSVEMDDLDERAYTVTAGLPEPIHLLGSEMLSVDDDGVLRKGDFDAAVKKIVTDVRKNKLETLLKKAGGGKYQKILQAMANCENANVPLEVIAKGIKQEQSQFSTNMATLVERDVIYKPATGVYVFTDPMLKEYIRINGVFAMDE